MARTIGVQEVEDLAVGAAVLGTGGGGDPYLGKLLARKAIEKYGPVPLLSPHEVPADALIIPTAMMGAPTVMVEKMPNGDESYKAMRWMEQLLGRKAWATMPTECGGLNSTVPVAVAAMAGIPLVDADGMGRAFPEMQQETFHIFGVSASPITMYNERGDRALVETVDNRMAEHICRGIAIRMGAVTYIAVYPMTGKQVKETAIPLTVSLAIRIGAAIREAKHQGRNPFEALAEVTANSNYGKAIVLFEGKIVDVERRTTGGFARGGVQVQGLGAYAGRTLQVHFQNENLIALVNGQVVATVPDLITFLDTETGLPLTTEELRYGFRVTAIGIPTPEIMRGPAAIAAWGPRYFGYDVDYRRIEEIHGELYSA